MSSSSADAAQQIEIDTLGEFVQYGEPDQNAFLACGHTKDILYDKSKIVGMCGAAGTGKSRGILEKIHIICEKYERARYLIARKTRESLSQSALFTFEEKVVQRGHPILRGPQRIQRSMYRYPNGSEIVIGGLDDSQKFMSTDFDGIYIQELIECSQNDLEDLLTRLRNGRVPYQQLLFDTNPGKPLHWVYQGALAGKWKMYNSYHEDNPTLWQEAPPSAQEILYSFPSKQAVMSSNIVAEVEPHIISLLDEWPETAPDGRHGRWTPHGVDYITTLNLLSGAKLQRLRYGKWTGAEGTIYGSVWDADIHMIDAFEPPEGWRHVWSIDFGFTAPFVLQMFIIDPDGIMYLWKEIYHTHRLVSDHAITALEMIGYVYTEGAGHVAILGQKQYPFPETIICDHDAEGRADFEKNTGLSTTAAYKGVSDGIQGVTARLQVNPINKKARLYFMRGTVNERDARLQESAKPQSTVEEFDGYVWKKDARSEDVQEVPLKKDDHGCFVAGTLVETLNGPIAIEDVRIGSYVLTRNGYRKVLKSGCTSINAKVQIVLFSDGRSLIGTPNHPVFTQNKGFTPMDELRYTDDILDIGENIHWKSPLCHLVNQQLNELDLTELYIGVIQTQKTFQTETIFAAALETSATGILPFIGTFTNIFTEKYHTDTKYITKTKTHSTICQKISSVLPRWNIAQNMNHRHDSDKPLRTKIQMKLNDCSCNVNQQSGILPKMVKNGTVNTPKKLCRRNWQNKLLWFAKYALYRFRHLRSEKQMQNIVPQNATRNPEGILAKIISKCFANDATNLFKLTNINKKRFVRASVATAQEQKQAVYNLEIESEHEYYANGILVHNCDALKYAVASEDEITEGDEKAKDVSRISTERDMVRAAGLQAVGNNRPQRSKYGLANHGTVFGHKRTSAKQNRGRG